MFRSHLRALIPILALLAGTMRADAQWTQANGPEGGRVQSMVMSGSGLIVGFNPMLGARAPLRRHDGTGWSDLGITEFSRLYPTTGMGGVLFGATSSRLFRSTDNGTSWSAVAPFTYDPRFGQAGSTLYASSNDQLFSSGDAGVTWSRVDSFTFHVSSIAGRNGVVLIGTDSKPELLRSTDAGGTWSHAGNFPSDAIVRVLLSTDQAIYATTYAHGVLMTTDGGITWSTINTGIPDLRATFVQFVAAGSRLFGATSREVYAYDGGRWSLLRNETQPRLLADGSTLYLGSSSGVLRSDDGGATWTSMNTGLRVNDVTALGTNGSVVVSNARRGIFVSSDRGESWRMTAPYEVLAFASTGSPLLAISGVDSGIYRSLDDGTTWQAASSGITESLEYVSAIAGIGGTAYVGFNGTTDALGNGVTWLSGGVFRTTDDGASWTAVSRGLPRQDSCWAPIVKLYAYGDVVLAMTARGLYRSSDKGASWSKVDAGFDYAYEMLGKGPRVYALAWGNMYMSDDVGLTWTRIPETGTNKGAHSAGMAGDMLIVVWGDFDSEVIAYDGPAYRVLTPELPAGIMFQTFIAAGDRVLAGTRGSSIWMSPYSRVAAVPAPEPSVTLRASWAPDPFAGRSECRFTLDRSAQVRLTLVDVTGARVATLHDGVLEAGPHAIELDAAGLPAGTYFYQLDAGETRELGRIVKMR